MQVNSAVSSEPHALPLQLRIGMDLYLAFQEPESLARHRWESGGMKILTSFCKMGLKLTIYLGPVQGSFLEAPLEQLL